MKKASIKFLKITGLSFAAILLSLFLIPILFPGTVSEKIKGWTNSSLNGELNFSKVRLSFFNHFPSLTVTLYDFSLKGSAPFKKDTLVASKEIAFGINVKNLIFNNSINIDKIFLSDAFMNVQINEKGEANYNVYASKEESPSPDNTDTSSASLKLEKIEIKNSRLVYNDRSIQLLFNARGFNYTGSGDLSQAIFDLTSRAKIDSLDFYLGDEAYLINKKVNARLITKINTNSLAFRFEKNNLLINRLPVRFSGKLDFLKNGYDIDFTVSSNKGKLYNLITAFPPQYLDWLKKTKINGKTDVLLTLKGKYIASENTMPDLALNMKIRDGYVAYQKAPFPASHIFLNLDTKMPGLNPDSLQVAIDSVFFNIDKDYFSAVINTKGVNNPFISAKINTALDLEKFDKAFGLKDVDLRGKWQAKLDARGRYATGPNPNSVHRENILLSIPAFQFQSTLKGGYLKFDSLPQPVSDISFDLNSSCRDQDYRNTSIQIANLSATALKSFVKGNAAITNLKDMDIAANIQSSINLADIKNVYPLEALEITGLLNLDLNVKGRYDDVKKTFPATTANISLQNGSVKTGYYPNPISNIQIQAKASDVSGALKDLDVMIEPASFQFEEKTFTVQAALKNFEDLAYAIKAKGEIDIAKIYKVFSQKGLDLNGFIDADISLQGKLSDASGGNYKNLRNQGSLKLKNIQTSSEYFPKPFLIKEALFKFKQDKVWFNNFLAVYGRSDLRMNGYLKNIIDYWFSKDGVLKGAFTVHADTLDMDEFMVYNPENSNVSGDSANSDTLSVSGEKGVIIIPRNYDLDLKATADKISFNGLNFENAKGEVGVKDGTLSLKTTGFTVIGCDVIMNATYGSEGLNKAFFDYSLEAKDFDIKKAYNEIKLFHDMASAAEKAEGIVSLKYNLKGKLDGNMQPIYPSLEGGGVLSLKNIKVKGLKLFSMISQKTGKDSINDPNLSKVDIHSTIKNNVITIKRFKFKVAGFRPRIEGKTNFDGQLSLNMRLGLPPLGIIGIPIKVTGTQEAPRISLGKNNKEEVTETEYEEEPLKQ